MELYARINILDGRAVRLPKGDVRDAVALDADPISRARGWVDKGVHRLHVVDLDAAAYGDYENRPLISEMIKTIDIDVQVAGGIRSPREAERVLADGAWRIVMGTAAIEDQNLVWDLCRDYPGRVAISLDVLPNEELVLKGWTANSGRFLEEVLIEMSSAGAASFMVQQAGRDALTEQPNMGILRRAVAAVDEPVIASGGVRDLRDLEGLMQIEAGGKQLAGVIVGREVTEGRFTIEQATAMLGD